MFFGQCNASSPAFAIITYRTKFVMNVKIACQKTIHNIFTIEKTRLLSGAVGRTYINNSNYRSKLTLRKQVHNVELPFYVPKTVLKIKL